MKLPYDNATVFVCTENDMPHARLEPRTTTAEWKPVKVTLPGSDLEHTWFACPECGAPNIGGYCGVCNLVAAAPHSTPDAHAEPTPTFAQFEALLDDVVREARIAARYSVAPDDESEDYRAARMRLIGAVAPFLLGADASGAAPAADTPDAWLVEGHIEDGEWAVLGITTDIDAARARVPQAWKQAGARFRFIDSQPTRYIDAWFGVRAEERDGEGGWRPIETCPLHTTVLLYRLTDLHPVVGHRTAGDVWMLEENGPEDGEHRNYPIIPADYAPTHWMPLSATPVEPRPAVSDYCEAERCDECEGCGCACHGADKWQTGGGIEVHIRMPNGAGKPLFTRCGVIFRGKGALFTKKPATCARCRDAVAMERAAS